jgi:hypothetical protein
MFNNVQTNRGQYNFTNLIEHNTPSILVLSVQVLEPTACAAILLPLSDQLN